MKKAIVERNLVVVLFVLVMVTFTFAQRDTERIVKAYTQVVQKAQSLLAAAGNNKQ